MLSLAEPGKCFVAFIFFVQGEGRRGMCDMQGYLAALSVYHFLCLPNQGILLAPVTQTTSLEEW
jgi:hypothetical protein